MRRIALAVQYDGKGFCGWQRQREGLSVQSVLEDAIQRLDPHRPIETFAAGRTDSGVHASGQVVHFDCSDLIPGNRWAPALNGRLPESIRVLASVERPLSWHACYSACYRRYRYTIYNGRNPNLFLAPWSWHRYQVRLDEGLMEEALISLKGTHDFSAFQRSGSQRAHARTTIQEVELERYGDLIRIEIQATGFLYGMVRLLVGQLVAVGEHRLACDEFEERWKQRRRKEVKEAAPALGLCLLRIGYPEELFSGSAWFDSQPLFSLFSSNAPPMPFLKGGNPLAP